MQEPTDLVPLPTMPYDERPSSLPLDVQECRTAIWRASGNISKAAEILKIPSSRFRRFVKDSPFLVAEMEEANEILKDRAVDIVREALDDGADSSRRDSMAKFVLSNLGRDRGFGQTSKTGGVNLKLPQGNFTITWEDGSNVSGNDNDANTIEGEVVNE